VCFGLAENGRATLTETVEFGPLGRTEVRRRTVMHALALLLRALRGANPA
jgi:nicotinamide-nucleotide amidase